MKQLLFPLVMLVLSFVVAKAQDNQRVPAKGFAVDSTEGHFHPNEFTRPAVGDNDILIEIQYAGICHSDLHAAWNEHTAHRIQGAYPMVTGHEIAGRVVKVGKNVTKFKALPGRRFISAGLRRVTRQA